MTGEIGPHAPIVIVAATLDTKATQVGVVVAELRARGIRPLVVDCGTGTPLVRAHELSDDAVEREEVQQRAVGGAKALDGRSARLSAMAEGLAIIVAERVERGTGDGIIALGGGTGANLAAGAFAALPFSFPKVLVSTSVSGDIEAIAGDTDVTLVQPAVDLVGASAALELVLRRAAATIAAMVEVNAPAHMARRGATVGVTAFGVTSAAVDACAAALEAAGHEVLVFHARGSGGRTLERMVAEGQIDAVLDLTITEIADEVAGGMRSAGPGRLDAALRRGIPLVIVPGAIDVLNFTTPSSVPEDLNGRRIVFHTPTTTLVRSSAEESVRIADWIADKIRTCRSPESVSVVIPVQGFSALDAPGQPFFAPDADRTFAQRMQERVGDAVSVEQLDMHIADPGFADAAVTTLLRLITNANARTLV